MATHASEAELVVRLYELRQQDPYRSASRWLDREFDLRSWPELEERYPVGSDGYDALRTVLEHWDLVGGLVVTGKVSGDLLFETTGEHLAVWDKLQKLILGAREKFGDPTMFENLEMLVRSHAGWARNSPPKRARIESVQLGESS